MEASNWWAMAISLAHTQPHTDKPDGESCSERGATRDSQGGAIPIPPYESFILTYPKFRKGTIWEG